jgi:hypothetical protein
MPPKQREVVPVVCFFSDMNLENKRCNFSGHLDPNKVKELIVNDMFEKVKYEHDYHGDNITLTWKPEYEKMFSDLTEIWKTDVGAYRDDPPMHTSFFNSFVLNVLDPPVFYQKK